MRLLLTVQKGCTSYQSLRTVNNIVYSSYEEACHAMGLLADDKEFIDTIKEVAELASGIQLKKLFVSLLVSNTMTRPQSIWKETWELLIDGILYDRRRLLRNPGTNYLFQIINFILILLYYINFDYKCIS